MCSHSCIATSKKVCATARESQPGRDHGIVILKQPPSVLTRSDFHSEIRFRCQVLTKVAECAMPLHPAFRPCVTFTTTPVVLAPTQRPAATSKGSSTASDSFVLL